jgi:hypothetical protein
MSDDVLHVHKMMGLALMLVLASCTSMRPQVLDCDELSASALRSQIDRSTSSEQLRAWVSDAYDLQVSDIRAEVFKPGEAESIEWQKDGITYLGWIEGARLTDVTISYGAPRPPADRFVACLGSPERYSASYRQMVEGNQLGLDLLFAAQGSLVYGAKFTNVEETQPPAINGNFLVTGLRMVKPGSAVQVLGEIYGGPSSGAIEGALNESKPWPGQWKSIVVDIDPAIKR